MKTAGFFVSILSFSLFLIAEAAPGAEVVKSNQTAGLRERLDAERFDPGECFDTVWQTVNDGFWDPHFNGVDWHEARRRYRPRALAAEDHESFAAIVNQMLRELKTSHTRYFTRWDQGYYGLQAVFKSAVWADVSTAKTSVLAQYLSDLRSSRREPHRTGIGVVTREMDGRHHVTAVLKSSPAERAGIVLGDWLVDVEDRPFHPIRSFEGMVGRKLRTTYQRGSSTSTRRIVEIVPVDENERDLFESDSRASVKIVEHKGRRFTYVRLWWLSGLAMRQAFQSALDRTAVSEGLILDIRDGFGGGPYIEYIDPFLRGDRERIAVESIYRRTRDKYTVGFDKPVIVLINGGSRSGKELLAYCFKKWNKALLVGQRTAGFVTGGNMRRISPDSLLYYGACMKIIDGKRLEGVGVEPDIAVPFDITFAAGRDPQLERAKDEMIALIETVP